MNHVAELGIPRRVGLVAGWGRFPIVIAEALQRQGADVFCLGIKDHADESLRGYCQNYRSIGVAKTGGQIRYFHHHDVHHVTLAGKLFKHRLLYDGHWVRHLPDLRALKTALPFFITKTKDRNDDALIGAFVDVFSRAGIEIVPATQFAPELLMNLGQFAGARLTADQRKDIEFGWRIAKQMGGLDIGQSVAVKGRAVLALEAVEGTDACIRRAGELCKQGGFTVVKVAKPQQDMRFDVPTIGLGTVETMVAAGASVLAVEAGKTIMIDEPQVVAEANRHGITLIAVEQDESTTAETRSLPHVDGAAPAEPVPPFVPHRRSA